MAKSWKTQSHTMVQGDKKLGGKKKEKQSKKHRQEKPSREGLKKVAKKPKRGKDAAVLRMKLEQSKKLTGRIGNHIEQLMVQRVVGDRGPTAAGMLSVVKQEEQHLFVTAKSAKEAKAKAKAKKK